MNTILIERAKTQMIAHRGLSGLERENTNAAFVAAGNRSYFGIETDVHKTADGKFVIIHDEHTRRVSAGAHDIDVEHAPLSDAQAITLPDLDGALRCDLRIPTLDEYVRICKKYEKVCVLELKNAFSAEDIGKIVEIIRAQGYLENVIFISFVLENCVILREMLPEQKIQWLTSCPVDDALIDTLVRYDFALDSDYKYLTEDAVLKLHAHGIAVNCWTVNEKADGERLARMGVEFITTNILE